MLEMIKHIYDPGNKLMNKYISQGIEFSILQRLIGLSLRSVC